jgi:alcohol dehydrogenase class IV
MSRLLPSNEFAFEMVASNVRFGAGVTRECGMDLADLAVRRALVVTDPNVARLPPLHTVLDSLRSGPRRADRRVVPRGDRIRRAG